jgi:hypothetical protein
LITGRPSESSRPDEAFGPSARGEKQARRPGLGFGPRPPWPSEQRGGAGRVHGWGISAPGTAAVRWPPTASGRFWSRVGEVWRAKGLRGKGEHDSAMQGEKERARAPVAERELGGPARWRVREDAQLSLTVDEQSTRWPVRRRGGGGGADGKTNRKEMRPLSGNSGVSRR